MHMNFDNLFLALRVGLARFDEAEGFESRRNYCSLSLSFFVFVFFFLLFSSFFLSSSLFLSLFSLILSLAIFFLVFSFLAFFFLDVSCFLSIYYHLLYLSYLSFVALPINPPFLFFPSLPFQWY